jgi:phosphoethanolamine N-methyltransferase
MEPRVQHRVQFHIADATVMMYPESFYDVVYSRDTILHIKDKLSLFKSFYSTLKPGMDYFISILLYGK